MKNSFFSLMLLIGSTTTNAQVEIYQSGETTDLSGTTVNVGCTADETLYDMEVLNTSGETLVLNIKRKRIVMLEGTDDKFCWAGPGGSVGNCYDKDVVGPFDEFTSDNSPTIPNGEKGFLQSYHIANEIYGTVQYRYYVINNADGEALDSVDIVFSSVANLTPITETTFQLWPNPTVNGNVFISVENELSSQTTFTLMDLTGKVVLQSNLTIGVNEVSVNDLQSGTYVYSISNSDGVLRKEKLLIQ